MMAFEPLIRFAARGVGQTLDSLRTNNPELLHCLKSGRFRVALRSKAFGSVAVGHCHLAYPSRGTPWALEECLGIADTVVLEQVGSTEACGWFEDLT